MKNNLSSHVTDPKNQISQTRISQLKTFFTTKDTNEAFNNIKSALEQNNKPVKKPLRKFVDWYVKTLNQNQINQIYHKLVKISDFIDTNPL
jgi:uncharacterized protein YpuA (DUF1002 family)